MHLSCYWNTFTSFLIRKKKYIYHLCTKPSYVNYHNYHLSTLKCHPSLNRLPILPPQLYIVTLTPSTPTHVTTAFTIKTASSRIFLIYYVYFALTTYFYFKMFLFINIRSIYIKSVIIKYDTMLCK